MTVAVPVERYSPFPWKHSSHLPCSEHQPYCCYHDKAFAASDGSLSFDDVPANTARYNGCTGPATSLVTQTTNDDCAVRQRSETPLVKPSTDCYQVGLPESAVAFRPWNMGGRSVLDEGAAEDDRGYHGDTQSSVSCLGSKKRKLSDMLEESSSDCICRTPNEMTIVSESLQINSTGVVRCCIECGPTQGCCNCDPDDFFPDVSSEVELPMCYDSDDFKSRSISCTDSTSNDLMDNVIPDILPSCRTADMTEFPDNEGGAEGMIACDRKRILDISLHKMHCIDDPEVSLRRSVLIANMVTKLRSEIRQEDYCRTVLPKKRRSYRRTWNRSPERMPESFCFYQGNQPRRRLPEDVSWEAYPTNDMIPYNGGKPVDRADDQYHEQSQEEAQEEEKNSLLGDIDSIFQSLMACVGGP